MSQYPEFETWSDPAAGAEVNPPGIRTFSSGATRDSDAGKPDYEGFLSPRVLQRFGQYMSRHRTQSDGSLRASDNWQRGIPCEQYMKSLLRHTMDAWALHRGGTGEATHEIEEALCGVLFNAQGYLHERLTGESKLPSDDSKGYEEDMGRLIGAVGMERRDT